MSKRSDAIVKGPSRAAARAMLRATGMDDENFEGPIIAVFNTGSTRPRGYSRCWRHAC